MSLPIYQRVAVTDAGDVIPGAEYTVINENTGVAAPIYSDRTGATLLSAPYFADSVGTIQFYIAAGTTFRVAASGGVGTYTDRYIYAAHPQSSPTDTTANALMAVGAFGLGGDVDLRNTIYSTGTPDGLIGKGYAIGLGSGSALGVVVTGVGTLEVAGVYGGTGVHSGFTRRFTAQGRTFVQSGLSGAAWGDWHEIIIADAAGNVGIGKSSPIDNLNIYDSDNNVGLQLQTATTGTTSGDGFRLGINNSEAFLWQYESLPLTFATSGSERMRIDSAGSLLVGTTTLADVNGLVTSHLLEGSSAVGGNGAVGVYNNTGSANAPALMVLNRDVSTDSTNRFVQFNASVTSSGSQAMGAIVGNGVNNAQFAATSDIREKTNIESITDSLVKIKSLRPVEFDWIESGEHCKAGFVAQEVETVFPEFVVENMARDGEEERKGLTGGMTGGIIPHLVKAIQEQQTIIEALTARIEILEAK